MQKQTGHNGKKPRNATPPAIPEQGATQPNPAQPPVQEFLLIAVGVRNDLIGFLDTVSLAGDQSRYRQACINVLNNLSKAAETPPKA